MPGSELFVILLQIRGNWSCENSITLQRDLKDRSGLKGWVMSDWGTCNRKPKSENNKNIPTFSLQSSVIRTNTHTTLTHSLHPNNYKLRLRLAGATHSMSINEGLDQEMPGAGHMSDDNLAAAVSIVDQSAVLFCMQVPRMCTSMMVWNDQ